MKPWEVLQHVAAQAKLLESISGKLNIVRRVDESIDMTIDRLLRERAAAVKVLDAVAVVHGDGDFRYTANMADQLDGLAKLLAMEPAPRVPSKEGDANRARYIMSPSPHEKTPESMIAEVRLSSPDDWTMSEEEDVLTFKRDLLAHIRIADGTIVYGYQNIGHVDPSKLNDVNDMAKALRDAKMDAMAT